MSTCEEHQKGNNFFSSLWFSILLPYLSMFFLVFSVGWIFCSQIHEHYEEYKKGNNIFPSQRFFVLLLYLTIFLCSFSLLDECFALRFMSTMKNTKNVTIFRMFCSQIHEHVKNTKKVITYFPSVRFFVLLPYLTIFS